MPRRVELTVLVENTAPSRHRVLAEHGLAIWMTTDDRSILFDTGQGMALEQNAKELGIDLGTADAVVLSHGHFDHTDGLCNANLSFPKARLFVHPQADQPRFSCRPPAEPKSIGVGFGVLDDIKPRFRDIVPTTEPTQIVDGVWTTGPVPRTNDFEDVGGPFYLDPQGQTPDPITDDQALYMETPKGLVVVLGCAHAGVINTLNYIKQLTGHDTIHALVGGMHLVNASDDRLRRSIDALGTFHIERIGPCHCTGAGATATLMRDYAERFVPFNVGVHVTFG